MSTVGYLKTFLKHKTMKHLVEIFKPLIDSIYGPNVALAGLHSLRAHGLVVTREPEDLDVVIFSPTKQQLDTLAGLDFFRVKQPGVPQYHLDQEVSVKFKKDGHTIDFLLEHAKCTPDDLLFCEVNGSYYRVQSIKNTIDAKLSFSRKNDAGAEELRTKDAMDLLDIHANNFRFSYK